MRAGAAAVAAAAVLTSRKSLGQDAADEPVPTLPPSPATQPWLEELALQQPARPVAALTPAPGAASVDGECGRDTHPAWAGFAPRDLYEVEVREAMHRFHPDLPVQPIWGYDGQLPGPLFHARYGRPLLVRFHNRLPPLARGPGVPEISVHLHNMHTPSESDGYPMDWFSETACGPTLSRPGRFKDHHYPMVYAGLDRYGGIGDPREALGTLWYHDHRVEFTAPNVYRGLAGFFLAFDDLDSGDERDPDPRALRLPSGPHDVPLLIADRQFSSDGMLLFDPLDGEGLVGDKYLINGKIQPVLRVARRKYRLRLLDGGPSRFYELQLRWQNEAQPFAYIANDGNLLPAPLVRRVVNLGVAERADIVVDFAQYPLGAELFLVNRIEQRDGRKPTGALLRPPARLLRIVVDREPDAPDPSRVPARLRPLPPIDLAEVAATRRFVFDRDGGAWTVNGRTFRDRPIATPRKGTAEIWELRNESGGWGHPVHVHFEEGRILTRNGVAPPAHERGRKDVFVLGPNETVRVFFRFRDFTGRYPIHCHNTIHEDHGMMARYDIVD